MFLKTIEMLGNEEQVAEYLPQAKAMRIMGNYAQTELGHGSNVAGLETTATLDEKTDEWVIHTPNIRATKFWPGGLGLMSNHAMVFARCVVGENDYGP
jgi:acyl-CoA oxidase